MAAPFKVEFHFDFGSPSLFCRTRAAGDRAAHGRQIRLRPGIAGRRLRGDRQYASGRLAAGDKNKPECNALETQSLLRRHNITKSRSNPFFPVNTLTQMRGAVAAEFEGLFEPCFRAVHHHMIASTQRISSINIQFGNPAFHVLHFAQLDAAA